VKENTFAAVVAAAGLSSRMGDFKPLLPFGNSTIIGTVIEAFRAAGAAEIIVVCGHRAEELAGYVRMQGAKPVLNSKYAESGMFESLCLGIQALKSEPQRVFLTPGDIPAISASLIRELLKLDAPWAVPNAGGKSAHPVMLQAGFIHDILRYSGDNGLRGALESIPGGAELPWQDRAVLLDTDTPEDYKRLLKAYTGQGL